jgi:hypothetical protein
VEATDEVEEQSPARLTERRIAKFIEDDDVHSGEVIGEPTLPSVAGLGLEPVDEIDDVEEPAAKLRTITKPVRPISNVTSSNAL